MNLYPTLKIEYKSALTEAEVIDRVKNRIEPNNIIGCNLMSEKKYIGNVDKNRFLIRNQVFGMRGVNPEINGVVESQEYGCKITLIACPTILTKFFMGIWLSFTGFGCISMTYNAIVKQEFSWHILIPYAFFAFGYGLMWASVVFGTEPDDDIIIDLLGQDSQLIKSS